MAGKDKECAADLNTMFRNPEIKGIFCSRGGKSGNRLLNLIDFDAIKKNPKVFMGLSDITVLSNAIYAKTGVITFYGQNIEIGFSRGFSEINRYTLEYFIKAIMTVKPIGSVKPHGKTEILKKGKANGILIGGNLAVLPTLLETEFESDWVGKILFWEESRETVQDIDFWLTHLRLCGVFEKIRGMVIGKVLRCDLLRSNDDWQKKKTLSINEVGLEICKDYKFPIIKGVAFGHSYPQITLPIGVKATIDTSKNLPFSVDEAGVK